ncbi:hypothetical protein EZS27_030368 [termite gut metagenome]|uniref:Uncharacterized protein n=1 Tax=termite gut metagenome TaxID=433724 RepID=A0A5J4QGS9_9ZZZZ
MLKFKLDFQSAGEWNILFPRLTLRLVGADVNWAFSPIEPVNVKLKKNPKDSYMYRNGIRKQNATPSESNKALYRDIAIHIELLWSSGKTLFKLKFQPAGKEYKILRGMYKRTSALSFLHPSQTHISSCFAPGSLNKLGRIAFKPL